MESMTLSPGWSKTDTLSFGRRVSTVHVAKQSSHQLFHRKTAAAPAASSSSCTGSNSFPIHVL